PRARCAACSTARTATCDPVTPLRCRCRHVSHKAHARQVATRDGRDEAPSDPDRKALRGTGGSRGLADHLAGLDARGAGVHALGRDTGTGADGLDVGVPEAAGATVRGGKCVTEHRYLTAHDT